MGATVTTGKFVSAFQAKGKTYYILFEETYEKNCHPHNPTWCCIAMGSYQDVMKNVFGRASAAEGGSLQTRAGCVSPETILRGWSLAFNKPASFHNIKINLRILERGSWREGIESCLAGELHNVLKENNRLDIWDKLISDDDEFTLSLHDNIELILSIFGADGIASPWRIIANHEMPSGKVLDENLIPAKHNHGRLPNTMNRLVKFSGQDGRLYYAEMQNDGSFANLRWQYSVIAQYAANQAYECEMVERGLGIKNIQAFREVLANEPDSTDDFDAFIDKSSVTPDRVGQFEYNLGIKFNDAPEVYKLPSVSFAIERVSPLLKVYYKRKDLKPATNDLLAA